MSCQLPGAGSLFEQPLAASQPGQQVVLATRGFKTCPRGAAGLAPCGFLEVVGTLRMPSGNVDRQSLLTRRMESIGTARGVCLLLRRTEVAVGWRTAEKGSFEVAGESTRLCGWIPEAASVASFGDDRPSLLKPRMELVGTAHGVCLLLLDGRNCRVGTFLSPAGRVVYSACMEPDQSTQRIPDRGDAYVVVREGDSWRDVFRLSPAQVMTVGRATTNRIVLKDELCSRNHCELYRNGSTWVLRDLGSRNGTMVNGVAVTGERDLESGDLIQIGPYELGFTFDLAEPFPEQAPVRDANASDTAFAFDVIDGQA